MPIQVLAPEVASAIAAGEVVERPVSVVKELLENSLDAGARRIAISVQGGGRERIEVADDGGGIPAAELPLIASRHATSKVATVEDLFAIRTLGFRGEALASIGTVSRLELVTCAAGESTGSRIAIEAGRASPSQTAGAPQGTVVRVADLFFNVPARLKFLKSEATERRRIETLVTRYAIAYPQVQMRLDLDGRLAFQSTGNGDRREVLASIYGLEVARQLIALPEVDESPVGVTGFVSPPDVHRSNRREVTLLVNGRLIQDPSLAAAVLQAYHGLLMVGRYPMAVLLIRVPPETVDVNVHPAKSEVRFREPERIFAVVQRVVRSTLLGQGVGTPFRPAPAWGLPTGSADPRMISPDWGFAGGGAPADAHSPDRPASPLLPDGLPLLRSVGQVGAAYLVAEGPDGIYLVDQHAAHERVLFEALMAARSTGPVESQGLLDPVTVEFPPWQAGILEEQIEVLRGLGLDVEPFGGGSFRIRALPLVLAGTDPQATLRAVVEDFEEDEAPLAQETEARLAARVCKRAAVKAGQVLSLAEQAKLLRDLEACRSPRTCPHGRPTMIHLSVETLERQFGRRG